VKRVFWRAYVVGFLVSFGCASASTVQTIKPKQLNGAVNSGTVRFTMPTGWRLHSVRTNDHERTLVPVAEHADAVIHVYPYRDPLHSYTQADFAQQYLASQRTYDATSTIETWGSVKSKHYGMIALYHYRTPHLAATERVFCVLIRGSTYVKIEFCAPKATGIAAYDKTFRDLVRNLVVDDI
jgi:hypothetical protein